MTKESIYELQKFDCNCNDCAFLLRNVAKQELQNQFHANLQKQEFDRERNTVLFTAYTYRDKAIISTELKKTFKPMKPKMGYGFCKKFNLKEVSFIPNTMQTETQVCFVHRR